MKMKTIKLFFFLEAQWYYIVVKLMFMEPKLGY